MFPRTGAGQHGLYRHDRALPRRPSHLVESRSAICRRDTQTMAMMTKRKTTTRRTKTASRRLSENQTKTNRPPLLAAVPKEGGATTPAPYRRGFNSPSVLWTTRWPRRTRSMRRTKRESSSLSEGPRGVCGSGGHQAGGAPHANCCGA
jgi:hypothetical protein